MLEILTLCSMFFSRFNCEKPKHFPRDISIIMSHQLQRILKKNREIDRSVLGVVFSNFILYLGTEHTAVNPYKNVAILIDNTFS